MVVFFARFASPPASFLNVPEPARLSVFETLLGPAMPDRPPTGFVLSSPTTRSGESARAPASSKLMRACGRQDCESTSS